MSTKRERASSDCPGLRDVKIVGEYDELLNCGICVQLMVDGVTCKNGHSFCRSCIETWLREHKKVCPMDQKKLLIGDLHSIPPIVKEMISKVKVACKSSQCDWTGEYSLLEGHLKECTMREVVCEECEVLVLAKDIAKHKNDVCLRRQVVCEHCRFKVRFAEMEKHVKTTCAASPDVELKCVCDETVRRGDMQKHFAADVFGHFNAQQRKFERELEAQNEKLRAQKLELDAQKKELGAQKRELDAQNQKFLAQKLELDAQKLETERLLNAQKLEIDSVKSNVGKFVFTVSYPSNIEIDKWKDYHFECFNFKFKLQIRRRSPIEVGIFLYSVKIDEPFLRELDVTMFVNGVQCVFNRTFNNHGMTSLKQVWEENGWGKRLFKLPQPEANGDYVFKVELTARVRK